MIIIRGVIIVFMSVALITPAAGVLLAAATSTPTIVAADGILCDLTKKLVANDAKVICLIPAGADPHTLALRPADRTNLGKANLVLLNGYGLTPALKGVKAGGPVVSLGEIAIPSNPQNDPHLWHDPANAAPGEVIVYKSPSCGCCAKWVDHMRDAGFEVKVNNTSDVYPIKQKYGLPRGMGSCHTAIVDGYVIEGHVPANDVQRLLAEKPIARGLAVPGMPIGSPGMEQGSYKERYEVILFGPEGSKVFARH